MGRRILAFILGMIFGIVLLLGGVVIAGVVAVTTVKPADVIPASRDYLGTLADMTLFDMFNDVKTLYEQNINVLNESELYFSIGDFLLNYEIGTLQDDGTIFAYGMYLPKDVQDIPVFEFLGGEVDGEPALTRVSKQIKISAVPAIVNMFTGGVDEEGNPTGLVSPQLVEELSNYTLADYFDEEKGLNYILQNVYACDLLPSMFPAEQTDDNAIMYAVGQTCIGKLLGAFGGETSLLLQLKDELDLDGDGEKEFNGALAAVGQIKFSTLVGNEGMIGSILGDKCFADLIDDNGALAFDSLINGIKLGTIMGYTYNEGIWTDANGNEPTGIMALFVDLSYTDLADINGVLNGIYVGNLMFTTQHVTLDDGWTNVTDGIYTNGNDYAKQLKCICEKTEHVHDGECRNNCSTEEHTHGVNCYSYAQAKLICDGIHEGTDAHELSASCYGYCWYTDDGNGNLSPAQGITALLADTTIGELMNGGQDAITGKLFGLTLGELLGDSVSGTMSAFADMTILELMGGGFTNIELGDILFDETSNNCRVSAMVDDNVTPTKLGASNYYYYTVGQNTTYLFSKDGKTFYLAHTCGDDTHLHDETCVRSVWKTLVCTNTDETHVHTDSCYTDIADIMGKLADMTVADLQGGAISDKIQTFTLFDVLGDGVPSMLDSLKYTQIGQLSEALNTMYLGDMLGYSRITVEYDGTSTPLFVGEDNTTEAVKYYATVNDQLIISLDGTTWYKGTKTCEHANCIDEKCYEFVWENDSHEQASGINKVLVNMTIADLQGGNIQDSIMDLTLNDLMPEQCESGIFASLKDTPISQLSTGINTMYLGGLLGFDQISVTYDGNGTALYKDGINTTDIIKYYATVDDQVILSTDNATWYKGIKTCQDDNCIDAKCYEFIWENDSHEQASGINKILVNMTIGDLQGGNMTDKVMGLTLYELMPDQCGSGIFKSLKDTPINQLSTAIDTLYVGNVMNYTRKEVDVASYSNTTIANLKYNSTSESYAIWDGTTWYTAKLTCAKTEHTHDDTCETDCAITEHTHTIACYECVWFDAENNEVTGINGALVNLTINDLSSGSGLTDAINKLKLSDIVDCSNKPLSALADKSVNELGTAFSSLKLGDVIECNTPLLKEIEDTHIDQIGTAINEIRLGTVLGLYENDGKWYEDENHTIVATGIKAILADSTIANMNIEGIKLGAVFGFVQDDNDIADGEGNKPWYQKCDTSCSHQAGERVYIDGNNYHLATGLQGALANLSIGDMSNGNKLTDAIKSVKLGDLIEISQSNAILYALKDSTIGNIGDDIQGIKLGIIFNLVEDDSRWYQKCTASCEHQDDETHIIGTEVYHLATGLEGKLADLTISGLSGEELTSRIQTMTMADLGVNGGSSKLMEALANTRIGQIGDEIDNMKLGIVLGYHKNDDNKWYDDGDNEVKGLNAKLADKSISSLGTDGLDSVFESMTMRDLVDSGIVNFSEDTKLKLNLISPGWENATVDAFINNLINGIPVIPG